MLTAVVLIFVGLIFPFYASFNVYYSLDLKKVCFGIYLFGFIKLVGGYIEKVKDGVAIHVSENKAYIITYKNLFNMGKKVKPLRDYHLINFNTIIEFGMENGIIYSSTTAFVLNYINSLMRWLLTNVKPHVNIDNKINIYEAEDKFNFFCRAGLLLNLLMLTLSFIKILVGKIYYAIANK